MTTYLKKADRYDEILKTAMNVIVDSGLATITARKIAAEANISVGQIHHHFTSISQLKALALLKVTDQLIQQTLNGKTELSVIEQIVLTVSPLQGEGHAVLRRLWNEALFLAARDQEFKDAYKKSIVDWHSSILKLLRRAVEEKQMAPCDTADLAWRLIALGGGLDNLAEFDEFRFSQDVVANHIRALLK